jgi:hypothetical protein
VIVISVLAIIAPALVLGGCIGGPDDDGDGARADGVTLVIDFKGFAPDTHAGHNVTWDPDGDGNWSLLAEPRVDNDTLYVVHNVTAGNVLEALVNASAVAGFFVESHQESLGAFVDAIDGLANGADGHYWSYYLNGEYGIISSDRAAISDGDEVRWVFMGNPFG